MHRGNIVSSLTGASAPCARGALRAPAAVALAGCLSLALAAPAFALPSASTEVNLQVDDSQISVTAPTAIDYAMRADGTFIAPEASATKIENHSAMPIAVKGFTATVGVGSAVAQADFAASTEANAWWNTVAPNEGAAVAFNKDAATLSAEWNMAAEGAQGDELALTCAGAMKNIDGTVDFSQAQKLATVSWTFGVAKNS